MTGINLLPQALKQQSEQVKINFKVFMTCFYLLVVLLIGLTAIVAANQVLSINLNSSQQQITSEEKEIAIYKNTEEKVKKLNEYLNLVSDIYQNQTDWAKIIKEIAISTPASLQINTLNTNTTKTPNFTATGTAASNREVAKFQEKLEASSYFKDVTFISSNKSSGDKPAYTFNITFNIESKK